MSMTQDSQLLSSADASLAASFPENFLWGAATASYQIEGATREDGRSLSIWDKFAATPGKTYKGETGNIATDHYHLWPQDVELMADLHLSAYRFSIAWPRILPEGRGAINTRGLDFYERLVDALLAKGISPFATLYHWDLPLALQDEGGWVNRNTASAFADYAEVVAKRLGDRIAGWITHNEPWCVAYLGHGSGRHAPGIQDKQAAVSVAHHVLLSHGLAVPRLRVHKAPSAQIGITLSFRPIYPADDRSETMRDVVRLVAPIPSACYTEMAWEIYPQSFTDLLVRLHRDYALPKLYVTENGAAFVDHWNGGERVSDPRRVAYLRDYIQAMMQALAQGAPVQGYFVWSLLDNYEWAEGYRKRFGIVYVDYPTQRRIIKDSGHWYTDLITAYQRRW